MTEPNPIPGKKSFVFQDPHGKRWPRLRGVLVLFGMIMALGIIWFFQTLFIHPELRLPETVRSLKGQIRAAIRNTEENDPGALSWQKQYELMRANRVTREKAQLSDNPDAATIGKYFNQSKAAQDRMAKIRAQIQTAKARGEIRLGLYVDWDPNSFSSLERHAGALTHVAPEWFTVQGAESRLVVNIEPRLVTFAGAHGLTLMPTLRNLSGDVWQPEAVENIANGSADKRSRFINDLVASLQKAKAGGLILDWEELDPAYQQNYTDLIAQIGDALAINGMELWFMVSLDEDFQTFDIEALQLTVDRFVAVLHDEHSDTDQPGPIASQAWVDGWLQVITERDPRGGWIYGEPAQWIGLIGAYAYDWNTTTNKTETIGFKDAMSRARNAGLDREDNAVRVMAPSYNGAYQYSYRGDEHSVTFLDAISFYNDLRSVRESGLGGVGVSRLGSEDPHVWEVLELREPPGSGVLRSLGELKGTFTITNVGRGDIVSVDTAQEDGRRAVTLEPNGLLSAKYFDFPTYPILYHEGATDEHQVALTFDDGPDPKWTPKILDILRSRGVKAAFFLIGKNCEDHPELVQRLLKEGHEIGNHTYSHRNLAIMSKWQMELELTATQRLIESITGRSTTLFRPPYNADSTPTDYAELEPLWVAQHELDYTIVLEKIDPQDWARPGAAQILQRVKEMRGEGNLVLLHEAGGDRSQTVEALPKIIDYLRERGDKIVSIGQLIGVPRDELMPPVDITRQPLERMVSGAGFRLWHVVVKFFWAFMIFATALIFLRTLLVAWLARRHHRKVLDSRRAPAAGDPGESPPLSIIIAAYNEEKVIAKTLRSVVETDYPSPFEVIVVDDGSKDATAEVVARLAAADPRIRLVRQPNRGKAVALRHALDEARHGIVVFLDADTLFERATLRAIVRPFADPLVGAVSGNARVGNLRKLVAKFQSLEYICGFNLDRRAYTELNCITVVPGAVSAVLRSAITAAGGFSQDTLAEDTDLTLTLHRLGYKITYAPDAIAHTEAPETISTLLKQRFRWAFGTMQCLWKHRDLVFNPRFGALGWFSLPNIWFMQIGLVAVTPIVDLILLYSLYQGTFTGIWYWFVAVLSMDLFLAILACWLEGEPLRRAFWILPMRFIYRPLLAWVIWKSIFHALKGAFVTWGKIERTASVPSRA